MKEKIWSIKCWFTKPNFDSQVSVTPQRQLYDTISQWNRKPNSKILKPVDQRLGWVPIVKKLGQKSPDTLLLWLFLQVITIVMHEYSRSSGGSTAGCLPNNYIFKEDLFQKTFDIQSFEENISKNVLIIPSEL